MQLNVLYGAKIVDARPSILIHGGLGGSRIEPEFPWDIAAVLGLLIALLAIIAADIVFHLSGMGGPPHVFAMTAVGSLIGRVVVPFGFAVSDYLKARRS